MKAFKKIYLTALFAFLYAPASLASQAESKPSCLSVFEIKLKERQLELFTASAPAPQAAVEKPEAPKEASASAKPAPPAERPRKASRAELKAELLSAYEADDFGRASELLSDHPFLRERNIRFTSSRLIDQMPERHRQWCPEGWGLAQLAAYKGSRPWLQLLRTSGVDFRTKKGRGGLSLESNALHVAIKKQNLDDVRFILSDRRLTSRKGKKKGHFIDEKDAGKQTPFALSLIAFHYFYSRITKSGFPSAVEGNLASLSREELAKSFPYASEEDLNRLYKSLEILKTVAEQRPSGEVESLIEVRGRWVPMDGFELAHYIGRDAINIAYGSLRASPYYLRNKELRSAIPKTRIRAPDGSTFP